MSRSKFKTVSLPVPVSIALWIDLLGYTSSAKAIGYNPSLEEAKPIINRLREFHEIVAKFSTGNFRTLTINDGAIAYADLSLTSSEKTEKFVKSSWDLFKAVNENESTNGQIGARAVIAVGFRARGRSKNQNYADQFVRKLIKKIDDGNLTVKQALYEAIYKQQPFDVVPQLQANFAFTKAYVAEDWGSKKGLPGPNLYVEGKVFKEIEDMTSIYGDLIEWEDSDLGINTEFINMNSWPMKSENINVANIEFSNGLEVASRIDPDPKTLERITEIKSWKFT